MSDNDAVIPPSLGDDEFVSAHQQRQLRRLVQAVLRREMEALRLYEPLPVQDDFHRSTAPERILWGSNRGGKTTPAAMECGRAVTGQDPYGKYPKTNGRAVLVANSEDQIAQVFYWKLFRSGAFKMIRDLETGHWRAYRPWNPEDKAREAEVKPSLPIIPPRLIKEIAWKNKKKRVPSVVRLHNGWELSFFTAGSSPPNGMDVDLVWFDEEVEGAGWYAEMAARLVDRNGRFFWSATPQNGTEDLFNLQQRAIDPDDPGVEEFKIKLDHNPHIGEREKNTLKKKYESSPDEYRVRIEGEFALSSYRIYPLFSMAEAMHGCQPFEITDRWNRYMVVDPGRQVCAVSFWAVPPPEWPLADQRYLYDELYITNCTAAKFAREVEPKVQGKTFMEFIIDPAAMKAEVGSGESIAVQYSRELEARGIKSAHTGSAFTMGVNDLRAGIEKLSGWMDIQPRTGRPILKVFIGRCRNWEWEIERYRKRKVAGVITDKPVDRNDHLMDTGRYFAMRDAEWREPPPPPKPKGYVQRHLELIERLESQKPKTPAYINIGPSISVGVIA